MLRKCALGLSCGLILLVVGCGGGSHNGAAGSGGSGAAGATGHAGATGAAGESAGGAGGAGIGAAGASGGAGSGAAGGAAGAGGSLPDAATDSVPVDATNDATSAPQCLASNQPCGDDGGVMCCEAYVCRLGKCCTPTGILSNCIKGSDCCSGSCILNQCTCVPKGYSCTGPGQCCSGFSCENGTCICPPDIRGCT
jgi:hypothetical protein